MLVAIDTNRSAGARLAGRRAGTAPSICAAAGMLLALGALASVDTVVQCYRRAHFITHSWHECIAVIDYNEVFSFLWRPHGDLDDSQPR